MALQTATTLHESFHAKMLMQSTSALSCRKLGLTNLSHPQNVPRSPLEKKPSKCGGRSHTRFQARVLRLCIQLPIAISFCAESSEGRYTPKSSCPSHVRTIAMPLRSSTRRAGSNLSSQAVCLGRVSQTLQTCESSIPGITTLDGSLGDQDLKTLPPCTRAPQASSPAAFLVAQCCDHVFPSNVSW